MLSERYRLDELGWAQFEQVCERLLEACGLTGLSWRGRADNVRFAVAPALPAEVSGLFVEGPVLVAVVWLKDLRNDDVNRQLARLVQQISDRKWHAPVAVLTNARAIDPPRERDLTVLGGERLEELIDAHPEARRRIPSLLGVGNLADLLDREACARSNWDAGSARALAPVFVPTGAYRATLDVDDGDWDALTERLYHLVPELTDPDLVRLLTTFEDGLQRSRQGDEWEFAALARAVLHAIARAWNRGESFASRPLLEQWNRVAHHLDEPPPSPAPTRIWEPPTEPRPYEPAPELTALPAVDWGSQQAARNLVDRILADLGAA